MAKVKMKLVKRSAPVANVKSGTKAEKTKSGRKGGATTQGRFLGTTTGLSVTKYQNKTILENAKKRFTDDQLAADWRREFPNARAQYTAETVRGVRGLVNKGKHGNDAPVRPVPEFDESGTALPFRGEKAAAAREAREARAEKSAPVSKKGKIVKKSGKK